MAKRKKQYRVKVACHNNKTGKAYQPGDIIKTGDFPALVIANWLALTIPVLEEIQDGGND